MPEVRNGFFYTEDHEWIAVIGNRVKIGISDHAQASLGDITYIELPIVGDDITAKQVISSVESVKAASDIYTPVSGEIISVNNDLEDTPEQLNSSPYDEGWIFEVVLAGEFDSSNFMDAEKYSEFLKTLG